jgi:hypothetical protein
VTLLYLVSETDAKQVVAAPSMPTSLYTYTLIRLQSYTSLIFIHFFTLWVSFKTINAVNILFESAIATNNF